jgi:hypothetical protein
VAEKKENKAHQDQACLMGVVIEFLGFCIKTPQRYLLCAMIANLQLANLYHNKEDVIQMENILDDGADAYGRTSKTTCPGWPEY